jgi:hypothetical protein
MQSLVALASQLCLEHMDFEFISDKTDQLGDLCGVNSSSRDYKQLLGPQGVATGIGKAPRTYRMVL